MPKQTFFNLSDEKKERLLEAAYHEFSKMSLDEVSINVIIHHAEISRGSFYQYFEDKEDLYFYCLHLLKKDHNKLIEDCFREAEGKLIPSLKNTFKILYNTYVHGENRDFYQQFFVNMSFKRSQNIYEKEPPKDEKAEIFYDLAQLIDCCDLTMSSEEELVDFLHYIFHMMHWTLSKVFLQQLSEEKAFGLINQRLSWMANGIIKNKE